MDPSSSLFDVDFGAEFEFFDDDFAASFDFGAVDFGAEFDVTLGNFDGVLTSEFDDESLVDYSSDDNGYAPIGHIELRALLCRHGIGISHVRG